MKKMIFVVDDSDTNLSMARNALEKTFRVMTLPSGEKLFSVLKKVLPDLILLDIEMPKMNGFAVLEQLKAQPAYAPIPVIFLTSVRDEAVEVRGLKMGVVDFVTKPFSEPVLLNRIMVHLNIDEIIRERTAQIGNMYYNMMFVFANIIESRDETTGEHIESVTKFLKLLIRELIERGVYAQELIGLDDKIIEGSALLHDIGKIGIPDAILTKPDKLTAWEYEEIKKHTTIGVQIIDTIISRSGSDRLLEQAKLFAAYHHEKWDGTGYPYGLSGLDIPIQGRIMALADVYDALTSDRPYKRAYSAKNAIEIIAGEIGSRFDPKIGEVFISLEDELSALVTQRCSRKGQSGGGLH